MTENKTEETAYSKCLEVKDFPDEIFAEIFEGGSEKK